MRYYTPGADSSSQKVNFNPLDHCYTKITANDRPRWDPLALVPSRGHYEKSQMKLLKKQDFSASIRSAFTLKNFISILKTHEYMSKV